MKFVKRIYLRRDIGARTGKVFANIHMLVGYNQGSISDFQAMAEEFRKTFPNIKDSEFRCSRVTNSASYFGFTLLSFDGIIEDKKYEGWTIEESYPDYKWA